MADKVLVTGASGWLGNRLSQMLCEQGRQVRVMVIPTHKAHPAVLQLRGHLARDSSLEVVEGDVRDKTTLKPATRGIDTVFHCAGVIHPRSAWTFYEINRDGTRNMLEACLASSVKRFIYVSSNAAQGYNRVYVKKNGRKVPVPMTEDMPCYPESDYGRSKLEAERIVNEFRRGHGIETVILRPPMFYGPRLPNRTIRFFNMVREGLPFVGGVPVFAGGNVYRSVVYIDNVCEALLLAEDCEHADGETYWIADDSFITWKEFLGMIAKNMDIELKLFNLPKFLAKIFETADKFYARMGKYEQLFHVLGEMGRDCVCSIEKAKRELGYKARISTEEGINKTITWMLENNLVG